MTKTQKINICLLLGLLIINLFSCVRVNADEDYVDPTSNSQGYTSVLYDNNNGLPTSEANTVVQTSEGFIWIGSYSGLVRYDGNDFVRYDSTTGIASVISLYVDSLDRLWIGTNDSGVFVLKNSELRKYDRNDGLKALSIREIQEDSNGIIYVATTRGIYYIDEQMVMHALDEPLINDAYIREFKIGNDDVIYGITNDGNLFVIKNKKLVGYYDREALGVEGVRCIYPDFNNDGYIYIGTSLSEMYYGKLSDVFEVSYEVYISPLYYINSIKEINGNL